jgi:hypothetical protein
MPLWQLPVVVTLVAAYIGCVTGKARTYNNVYVFYDEVHKKHNMYDLHALHDTGLFVASVHSSCILEVVNKFGCLC